MNPGEKLKNLRLRLGLTTREVEEYSHYIGDAEQMEHYFLSNTWLSEVENGVSTPSIYKLYSLSVIYGVRFTELLMFYNIDLERISKLHAELPMPHTRPTDLTVYDAERRISFPVRLDSGFKLSLTTFIPRMVEVWGEIPIGLLQHLKLRESAYGYVGTTDMTMYPILRPGSFVRIDTDYTKIETSQWRSEYERPIYFIELRNSFACSWCELHGKQLLLIPHPQSGCAVRQYSYPQDAEIVGRVTALAMSIVGPSENSTADSPKLPGQS